MKLFFNDPLVDSQLIRTIGHSIYNGADLGECLATAKEIDENNLDTWYEEWLKTANRIFKLGELCLEKSNYVSASEAFLRASNYYRNAYIFKLQKPITPELLFAYDMHTKLFKKATTVFEPSFEFIQIPYEDNFLSAYFCRADTEEPSPLLILTGGYDSTMEESYYFNVEAALRRGYSCLCFDGPGQGEALFKRNIPFRYDWENVIKYVVDYALTREDIIPEKIALMGLSWGGYLAPRAASGEPRLAACIADPGQYDIFEAFMNILPANLRLRVWDDSPETLNLFDEHFRPILEHPTKGWSFRRGLLVHQVDSMLELVREIKKYSIADEVHNIKCPTLVCAAEEDPIASYATKLYNELVCEKDFILFETKDGAGLHCESGNRSLFHLHIFNWLDEILKL